MEVWETGKYEEVESSAIEVNLAPVTDNDELREVLICLLLGYGIEDARDYLKKYCTLDGTGK